ncbi:hypothetical protein D3C76_869140 [compost metagenome]
MVGAAVIDRIEGLELFLVDPPHVANRVGKVRPLGVMPHQLRHHLDTRQAELIDGDSGDLFFSQLEQDRHRLERPAPLLHAFLEQCPVFRCQLQHFDDHIEDLAPVTGALAGHAQAEARPVVGDDHAVTVENQPARRRNRLHVHPIVLRQRRVVFVLDHLQKIQTGNQHANQHDDRNCTDHDTATHQTGVFFVILEANRLRH